MSDSPSGDSTRYTSFNPELGRFRKKLLDSVFRPFAALGLVALGLGSWRALRDGQWYFAVVYLALYIGSVFVAIHCKRLSMKIRSAVMLSGLYIVGVAGLLRLGIGGGVAVLVLVALCGLAAMLLGLKASLTAVALSVAALAIIGVGITQGYISLIPERQHSPDSLSAWIITTATFTSVTVGLIIPFKTLSDMLADSLGIYERQTEQLELSNEQLRTEIEKRQRAEEALRESELRYRGIFEFTSVSIWEEDLSKVREEISALRSRGVDDLRQHIAQHPEFVAEMAALVEVTDVNRATLELFCAESKDELIGSLDRILSPESLDAFGEVLIAMADGKRRFEGEALNRNLRGEPVNVLIHAAIPEDPLAKTLISVVDITALKQLEQTLAKAQKMESIGTLAGGIAHDFNNLLTGVQGYVTLMLRQQPSRAHLDYLRNVEQLVHSGAALTKQLLGFARGGKYDVRTMDLRVMLENTLTIFGRAKKEISTHLELDPELWTCDVDQSQLEQVLLNIYVNAWEAMPGGGDLRVAAHNVRMEPEVAQLSSMEAGDYVRISISDSGTGMDAKTLDRVFEPFFTTNKLGRGTGLGLASAYGIIQNHGGHIEAESEPGRGSSFTIYLPASKSPAQQSDRPVDRALEGDETILLIDDERHVLDATSSMLEELGYHVLSASGGAEGLRLFTERKAEISLVMLDIVMPEMSGYEVFRRLVELSEDVVVLIASGYSLDAKAEQLLKLGCRGFIQKPYGLEELSLKIREVLGSVPPMSARSGHLPSSDSARSDKYCE